MTWHPLPLSRFRIEKRRFAVAELSGSDSFLGEDEGSGGAMERGRYGRHSWNPDDGQQDWTGLRGGLGANDEDGLQEDDDDTQQAQYKDANYCPSLMRGNSL